MALTNKSIVVKIGLILMVLTSCESHEQKVDEAFNHYKEGGTEPKDSIIVIKEIIVESKKSKSIEKTVKLNEWDKFKLDINYKISFNDSLINKMKTIGSPTSKVLKRINNLESDNNNLKKQIEDYEKELKTNCEKFQEKLTTETMGINNELKKIGNK